MRSTRVASVLAAACLAAAGCGATVSGVAVDKAAPAAPAPARELDTVLPTAEELSAALGVPPTGLMGQLVEGGADTLLRGVDRAQATPVECVSATYRLQQAVYGASPVRSVASRSWAGGGVDGPVLSGFFGVVQLASPADAQAFFAAAAETWRQCDGRTLVLQHAGAVEQSRISDVVVDPRVVSAVVVHAIGPERDGAGGLTIQRALGVAADSIVDVEITDVAGAKGAGARDAFDVAGVMLAKLTG
ncbi:sensor domain-containing protein [Mycobacterium sp. PS03-16]|uniref:sensor domain-containing protein n=1 Tax=Mycobacterium sp. PS03-16 TaxID=2559611 RepID=UPI00107304C4|nr:sensor domain-containing protein [Mycobacterium sp. PS03-16]TFV58435.1 sensor domain-containing protein [Mycobacterium sp. PS03-16]